MTAKFLTTLESSAKVERIIRNAKEKLFLITPFLKLSNLFFERLKDADNRGVQIKMVYGKKELDSEELNNLYQLKNLELYYCESLHAKCYFNEDQMVITSLNLYDYSIKNNREMGISIKKEDDKQLFNDAIAEVNSIIDSSKSVNANGIKQTDIKENDANHKIGFCIRYRESIPFNPEKPLCLTCYKIWVEFGDPDYPESYCHSCGEKAYVTFKKPLCNNCYANLNY